MNDSNVTESLYNNDLDTSRDASRRKLFSQQTLRANTPFFNTRHWTIIFTFSGFAFFTLGCVILNLHANLSLVQIEYTDHHCLPPSCCEKEISLNFSIPKPVFMYYQIIGLYQNHRKFLNSRSDKQLLGHIMSPDYLSSCYPLVNDKNNKMYLPCGAMANSLFTDTFELNYSSNNKTIPVKATEKGIAWQSDIDRKYGILSDEAFVDTVKPKNWSDTVNLKVNQSFKSDEAFMNWMRPALRANFKKLYKIVEHRNQTEFADGLPAGKYYLKICGDYPVQSFNGQKYFILANTGVFGGANNFFPIMSIVLGVIHFLVAAFLFTIPWIKRKRKARAHINQRNLRTGNGYGTNRRAPLNNNASSWNHYSTQPDCYLSMRSS